MQGCKKLRLLCVPEALNKVNFRWRKQKLEKRAKKEKVEINNRINE